MLNWLRRVVGVPEKRSALAAGYTSEILSARGRYIAGVSGVGELTATVQSCVTLWENGFALADVRGTDLLSRASMASLARSLALRGEAVFLIREKLIPCADWDVATRDGEPRAYRLSVSEAGGARSETALAAEVLHVRIGCDPTSPWAGSSPLRRASLSAGLLQEVETALSEVYANAPIGSSIVPFPEAPGVDLEVIGGGFRGRRGRVLVRESVNVTAGGAAAPSQDWRPVDTTPDLRGVMPLEALQATRGAIMAAFGVLPAWFDTRAQGPLVREAQRHLAQWMLQPLAELIEEEATAKLGVEVEIDMLRPTQAFDAGGAARAFSTLVAALVQAKEGGLDPAIVAAAFHRLDWQE